MMYFGNRKPRGFHHTFMFVDERKELLRRLERQLAADEVFGAAEEKRETAGKRLTPDSEEACRKLGKGSFRQAKSRPSAPLTASFGIMLLAVALLVIFLCILMNF